VIYGGCDPQNPAPYSNAVNPMLTDMYQITMCYGCVHARAHPHARRSQPVNRHAAR
jgi:hypothetical protein